LVGPLDLRGGERGGAGGVAANRVEVTEDRPEVALEGLGELRDAPRREAGRDHDPDLCERDGERRHRDHAEEDLGAVGHALSRARACWYASRPRSIAVVSVSRPWLMASRPRAAASAARERASLAFSPSSSRVSRPDCGA